MEPFGNKTDRDNTDMLLPVAENFWREFGPACVYIGTDAYETALKYGDVSPDGERLGFEGAEPGQDSLDDVPPEDRPERL